MGFRIHRGIFQKLNAERTAYENTFKIGDDGRIKEVDSEGEVVGGYLKVGEQASDADTVDGYHANNSGGGIPVLNSNGYWNAPSWINVGVNGLYSSTTNGAHFVPNPYSYGSWQITGSRGGWVGLHFGASSGVTLMMNESESGIHREGSGWKYRHTGGKFYVHTGSNGGGTGYPVWHEGTISTSEVAALKTSLGITGLPYTCDIVLNGDPDTYYPVHFFGGNQDVWRRIIIRRGYGEQAPWDPIGTGAHRGGLLLDWEGNFGGWGGAQYSDRLRVLNESYTNIVADMYRTTHSMGYTFFLRGGGETGAIYHIFSDQAINGYGTTGVPQVGYDTTTKFYNHSNTSYIVYAPAALSASQINASRMNGLKTQKRSETDSLYLTQTQGDGRYLQSVPSTYATTSYVDTAVSNLVDSAPGALNTLNELAAALGDDASFSTTVTNAIAAKANSSHTHGIGGVTDASRWWNNFGDNHNTRTSFDAQGSRLSTGFGWRYVQGNGNGPGTDTSPHQFYALTVGLGNDYNYDSYGMQLVIPRNTATPYISVRFEEGTLGAWQKISAGYADTAGSANAVAWGNVSSKPSTFAPSSHNHNDLYFTETESDARYLGITAKAADSDKLDGVDSGSFLRSDASDSFSGKLTGTATAENLEVGGIRGTAKGSQTGDYMHLYERVHIGGPNGWGAGTHGAPSYGLSTWGGAQFNIGNVSNAPFTFNGSTIWHAGNDGSGSGLDADTVDGYHVSRLFKIDAVTRTGANFTDLIPPANETFFKELHQIETGVDYPAGAYTYGLLQSTKMSSMKFQWYVPHTGSRGDNNTTDTIYFRTGWGDSQIYAWKYLIHSGNIAGQTVAAAGTATTATSAGKLSTARNIALTGAVTGNANFDGSGNISIATTATSDPTLTLSGDASGSATFTNLGSATLSVTVNNNSHTHQPENVTGGILGQSGQIALANHPEGGAMLIPSFENDLAFIVARGGTVTTYITDATDYTRLQLNNLGASGFSNTTPFNGSTNYTYATLPSTASVVVYDIEMPFGLSYGNTFYVDFGAGAWQAKDVTFLAFHTDTNNSEQLYKVVGSTFSGVSSGLKFTAGSYSFIRTSDGGRSYSYNRLRVVMGNWDRTGVRIAAIGAKYYNSGSLTATLMSKGGGTMYGNLDVTGTVAASGGNSTNWNTAYGWGNHASASYAPSVHSHHYITNNYSAAESGSFHSWDAQESTPDKNPTTDWFTALRIGHGNPVSYYSNTLAMQMTGGDSGRIYTRTITNGSKGTWKKYWHGGDFTSTNISNWSTAYGWGNHASAGYVTSVTDALGYTPYQQTTALSSDKINVTGSHSSARVVVSYNHEGNSSHENSGNTVIWTSEPGISYNSSGIGGNIHESGHYYGKRNTNIPYGVLLRFDVNSGRAQFQTSNSTNNSSFRVNWYVDSNGNTVQQGSITAIGYNNSNWDTAYGWGNHASGGYLTSVPNLAASKITSGTLANARISQSSVTQHQSALSIAASQVSGLPAQTAPIEATVEGGNESTLASIAFSPGEGAATFTLADGQTFRLAFAR